MKEFVSAIILAAGKSRRMGKDKILMSICKKPTISYTLSAFEGSKLIDEIIIVGSQGNKDEILKLAKNDNISKFKAFTFGGKTRQESALNGLKLCSSSATYFAIHDGARILITDKEIEKVVETAMEKKAAVLGVPVKDTIKVVNPEGKITYTPDRSSLWMIQTPQVFEKNLYLHAVREAKQSNLNYTDDSQLIENIGQSVYVVEGSYSNIKLTTKEDIRICEDVMLSRTN